MTQRYVPPSANGPLRFVDRGEFARTSFPQPACAWCRYLPICHELLDGATAGEFWLVRNEYATSSDGRAIDRCARNFSEMSIPPDVTVLRHRLGRGVLDDFVARPGDPPRRPREARHIAPQSAIARF